jgi:sterol desaturase/sphingolipid hydroxylase (fatty acid hydroxylase superfamily)
MEDVFLMVIVGSYALLVGIDQFEQARAFPEVRRWRLKGLAFYAMTLGLSLGLPLLWDRWLAPYRLIDATGLGTFGGAAVGLLAYELGSYWWHRSLHRVPFLWRWFHQLHHSAERVDIFGAAYLSPLDVAGFSFVSSLALVLLVGVSGEAALIAGAIATMCSYFQHANLRTPRWLGYLVQRPEMHSIHHERGVHAYNYGNLGISDLLFGTFKNPETWSGRAGFYDGGSRRLRDMLLGREIAPLGEPEGSAQAVFQNEPMQAPR